MGAALLWVAALTILAVGLRGAKYSVRQNANGTYSVWVAQNFRKRKATEIDFLTRGEARAFIGQLGQRAGA